MYQNVLGGVQERIKRTRSMWEKSVKTIIVRVWIPQNDDIEQLHMLH